MIHHAVDQLVRSGAKPRSICYISVDHPIYTGCSLEDLLTAFREAGGVDFEKENSFVFLDEIQYVRAWEVQLKTLVDTYGAPKLVASGSAAAALRMKSDESGAGRFTDFLLPPLTFHEYLQLRDQTGLIRVSPSSGDGRIRWEATDIDALNRHFVDYLNFGGYPEAIFSPEIQADPGRFIKADIIDKVLLRDLPSLYGIQDVQELNYLFTTLAFNTADEISLEALSRGSGVAKNTIKRYLEYLEAAFLIKTVHRIDRSAKRFLRANFFKVYLTNPSMRSALFSPITSSDPAMGALAETGILSQWFHAPRPLYYGRWTGGEVDIVYLDPRQKATWAVEVKWSDRPAERPGELRPIVGFCETNGIKELTVTTLSAHATTKLGEVAIRFVPSSVYCYTVGYNVVRGREAYRASSREET